ncbi:MAG: hypothetical protein ACI9HK_000490 [Pirellulaceae bacterium]
MLGTSKPLRYRREWRIFIATFAVCGAFAIGAMSWLYAPTFVAYWRYSPQEGDVLFQSLPPSKLVVAIEGATMSPFSHCGVVAKRDGDWVVYEAFEGVEETPLREFVMRGREQGFAVYRLREDFRQFIPAMIKNVKTYLGREYDVRYRMDDEKIYCSELIYKAYRDASGGEKLGDFVCLGDLNWQPYETTITHFEQGPVPLDREMITPRDMARAKQLELLSAHRISVE